MVIFKDFVIVILCVTLLLFNSVQLSSQICECDKDRGPLCSNKQNITYGEQTDEISYLVHESCLAKGVNPTHSNEEIVTFPASKMNCHNGVITFMHITNMDTRCTKCLKNNVTLMDGGPGTNWAKVKFSSPKKCGTLFYRMKIYAKCNQAVRLTNWSTTIDPDSGYSTEETIPNQQKSTKLTDNSRTTSLSITNNVANTTNFETVPTSPETSSVNESSTINSIIEDDTRVKLLIPSKTRNIKSSTTESYPSSKKAPSNEAATGLTVKGLSPKGNQNSSTPSDVYISTDFQTIPPVIDSGTGYSTETYPSEHNSTGDPTSTQIAPNSTKVEPVITENYPNATKNPLSGTTFEINTTPQSYNSNSSIFSTISDDLTKVTDFQTIPSSTKATGINESSTINMVTNNDSQDVINSSAIPLDSNTPQRDNQNQSSSSPLPTVYDVTKVMDSETVPTNTITFNVNESSTITTSMIENDLGNSTETHPVQQNSKSETTAQTKTSSNSTENEAFSTENVPITTKVPSNQIVSNQSTIEPDGLNSSTSSTTTDDVTEATDFQTTEIVNVNESSTTTTIIDNDLENSTELLSGQQNFTNIPITEVQMLSNNTEIESSSTEAYPNRTELVEKNPSGPFINRCTDNDECSINLSTFNLDDFQKSQTERENTTIKTIEISTKYGSITTEQYVPADLSSKTVTTVDSFELPSNLSFLTTDEISTIAVSMIEENETTTVKVTSEYVEPISNEENITTQISSDGKYSQSNQTSTTELIPSSEKYNQLSTTDPTVTRQYSELPVNETTITNQGMSQTTSFIPELETTVHNIESATNLSEIVSNVPSTVAKNSSSISESTSEQTEIADVVHSTIRYLETSPEDSSTRQHEDEIHKQTFITESITDIAPTTTQDVSETAEFTLKITESTTDKVETVTGRVSPTTETSAHGTNNQSSTIVPPTTQAGEDMSNMTSTFPQNISLTVESKTEISNSVPLTTEYFESPTEEENSSTQTLEHEMHNQKSTTESTTDIFSITTKEVSGTSEFKPEIVETTTAYAESATSEVNSTTEISVYRTSDQTSTSTTQPAKEILNVSSTISHNVSLTVESTSEQTETSGSVSTTKEHFETLTTEEGNSYNQTPITEAVTDELSITIQGESETTKLTDELTETTTVNAQSVTGELNSTTKVLLDRTNDEPSTMVSFTTLSADSTSSVSSTIKQNISLTTESTSDQTETLLSVPTTKEHFETTAEEENLFTQVLEIERPDANMSSVEIPEVSVTTQPVPQQTETTQFEVTTEFLFGEENSNTTIFNHTSIIQDSPTLLTLLTKPVSITPSITTPQESTTVSSIYSETETTNSELTTSYLVNGEITTVLSPEDIATIVEVHQTSQAVILMEEETTTEQIETTNSNNQTSANMNDISTTRSSLTPSTKPTLNLSSVVVQTLGNITYDQTIATEIYRTTTLPVELSSSMPSLTTNNIPITTEFISEPTDITIVDNIESSMGVINSTTQISMNDTNIQGSTTTPSTTQSKPSILNSTIIITQNLTEITEPTKQTGAGSPVTVKEYLESSTKRVMPTSQSTEIAKDLLTTTEFRGELTEITSLIPTTIEDSELVNNEINGMTFNSNDITDNEAFPTEIYLPTTELAKSDFTTSLRTTNNGTMKTDFVSEANQTTAVYSPSESSATMQDISTTKEFTSEETEDIKTLFTTVEYPEPLSNEKNETILTSTNISDNETSEIYQTTTSSAEIQTMGEMITTLISQPSEILTTQNQEEMSTIQVTISTSPNTSAAIPKEFLLTSNSLPDQFQSSSSTSTTKYFEVDPKKNNLTTQTPQIETNQSLEPAANMSLNMVPEISAATISQSSENENATKYLIPTLEEENSTTDILQLKNETSTVEFPTTSQSVELISDISSTITEKEFVITDSSFDQTETINSVPTIRESPESVTSEGHATTSILENIADTESTSSGFYQTDTLPAESSSNIFYPTTTTTVFIPELTETTNPTPLKSEYPGEANEKVASTLTSENIADNETSVTETYETATLQAKSSSNVSPVTIDIISTIVTSQSTESTTTDNQEVNLTNQTSVTEVSQTTQFPDQISDIPHEVSEIQSVPQPKPNSSTVIPDNNEIILTDSISDNEHHNQTSTTQFSTLLTQSTAESSSLETTTEFVTTEQTEITKGYPESMTDKENTTPLSPENVSDNETSTIGIHQTTILPAESSPDMSSLTTNDVKITSQFITEADNETSERTATSDYSESATEEMNSITQKSILNCADDNECSFDLSKFGYDENGFLVPVNSTNSIVDKFNSTTCVDDECSVDISKFNLDENGNYALTRENTSISVDSRIEKSNSTTAVFDNSTMN